MTVPASFRAAGLVAGLVLLILGAASESAWAIMFQLGSWDSAIEAQADLSHLESKTSDAARSTFDTARTQERFTLRNSGAYVLDPRVLHLSIAGTFGLSQEYYSSEGSSRSRDGTLEGYDLSATILSDKPVGLELFANRQEEFAPNVFTSQSKLLSEQRGATLWGRRLYIPSRVMFRQVHTAQTTRTGDSLSRFDVEENIVTYQGRRGWLDSEMDVNYEFTDSVDAFLPTSSYRQHDGGVTYSLDFGPELSRRWNSSLRYFKRTGAFDYATANADETLHIDHSDNLRSWYRYNFIRTTVGGGSTSTHLMDATAVHHLFRNLTTDVGVNGIVQQLEQGHRNTARGHINFAYQKRLPWDGWLRLGLGGAFDYQDEGFGNPESFIPREEHNAASPIALPITLDNPFAISSNPAKPITIEKTPRRGPLPPGCVPPPPGPVNLQEGRDYTVRTIGAVTEIVPIPCSGAIPGINPGDTIAVSYFFAVPTSLTFTTGFWQASVSLDYGWIRPYYLHEQIDQHQIGGSDSQFLNNQQSDTAGIELRYDQPLWRVSTRAEARRYLSHRISYNNYRASQSAAVRLLRQLTMNLTGEEGQTDYTNPARHTRSFAGHGALSYMFARRTGDVRMSADVSAGVQVLQDSLVPTEQTTNALLAIRWFWRNLEVSPTLGYYDIERGSSSTTELRLMLHTVRRF